MSFMSNESPRRQDGLSVAERLECMATVIGAHPARSRPRRTGASGFPMWTIVPFTHAPPELVSASTRVLRWHRILGEQIEGEGLLALVHEVDGLVDCSSPSASGRIGPKISLLHYEVTPVQTFAKHCRARHNSPSASVLPPKAMSSTGEQFRPGALGGAELTMRV